MEFVVLPGGERVENGPQRAGVLLRIGVAIHRSIARPHAAERTSALGSDPVIRARYGIAPGDPAAAAITLALTSSPSRTATSPATFERGLERAQRRRRITEPALAERGDVQRLGLGRG